MQSGRAQVCSPATLVTLRPPDLWLAPTVSREAGSEAIAGLLHDVVEDQGGKPILEEPGPASANR